MTHPCPTPPRRTPLVVSRIDPSVLLKDETVQIAGSFKYRGVYRRLYGREMPSHCIAASTGNHALSLATYCSNAGLTCRIHGPAWASAEVQAALLRLGADVRFEYRTFEMAESRAMRDAASTAALYVPSFDSDDAISGHADLVEELCSDVGHDQASIYVPCGGGALLAAFCRYAPSSWRIVGVQRAGVDSMRRSLLQGARVHVDIANTVATGINLSVCGAEPLRVCVARRPEMYVVEEEAIVAAMKSLRDSDGICASGAGATAVAAAILDQRAYRRICIVTG